jgi:hypothetical protein
MRGMNAWVAVHVAVLLAPLFGTSAGPAVGSAAAPVWPRSLEGRTLFARPLEAREAAWARELPGAVARFTDGRRDVLVRWVRAPTRALHAAADCFRGAGFAVAPLPLALAPDGRLWGRTRVRRGATDLVARELIVGADGTTFADVSAWYWNAMLGRSRGPWWAFTVLEAGKFPAAPGESPGP